MPAVHGPVPSSKATDPFYGHEQSSKLCARFITHLFACPEYPPSSSGSNIKLPYFIAYALHRTKLHSSVTFAALVLLQRLKARFPLCKRSRTTHRQAPSRLFVSAFMLASTPNCDDTYSNKSSGFEDMVRKDFAYPGPYHTYILPSATKTTPPPTAIPLHRRQLPSPSTGDLRRRRRRRRHRQPPSPSLLRLPAKLPPHLKYGQRYPSPPKPTYPPPPVSQSAHMTPPTTLDTPSPSYTLPASSASPPTPPGLKDLSAKNVSALSSRERCTEASYSTYISMMMHEFQTRVGAGQVRALRWSILMLTGG
ncbi:hypothetical protein BJ138DRAFT_1138589 [Hygrophoropsis aurantiaca]|uniref:Uncharacterized protein n=1 Tax=Hygrophoropsis aurantiaca TaxID=72124 RepID=A0ACB7ZSP5_9AGAM|nr:hypothetical protein BJ138DRAFT_1138589 [Hygrophoropsis aurantiaca]